LIITFLHYEDDVKGRKSAIIQILEGFTDRENAERVSRLIEGLVSDFMFGLRTGGLALVELVKIIVRICVIVAREISKAAAHAIATFLRMLLTSKYSQQRVDFYLEDELYNAIGTIEEFEEEEEDTGYYEKNSGFGDYNDNSDEDFDNSTNDDEYNSFNHGYQEYELSDEDEIDDEEDDEMW